jgi:hypothetical protein
MLLTSIDHEFPQFPFMATAGTQAWRSVALELAIPYVLVNFAVKEDRTWLSQTAILWRDEDVLDFCRNGNAGSNRRIRNIAVLVPPSRDRSPSWSMVQVKDIWSGTIFGFGTQLAFYIGLDGIEITQRAYRFKAKQIEEKKIEYRYRNASRRRLTVNTNLDDHVSNSVKADK